MNIWENRYVVEIIDELTGVLRKSTISSENTPSLEAPRFIFVCGKQFDKYSRDKSLRTQTINLLNRKKKDNLYNSARQLVWCIVSEKLYNSDLADDIFSFEEVLAEISHKIIIIAESPGTYCELGAFIMKDDFCEKTIVINEDREEYKNSFITLGPIKYLEQMNEKNVILYNGCLPINDCMAYIRCLDTISNEPLKIRINEEERQIELKSLIYELINLIEIFQPIAAYELEELYKRLKGFKNYTILNSSRHKMKTFSKVLVLMEKMGLISKKSNFIYLNPSISCYNIMFRIERKKFNDIRLRYLNQVYKYQPERMAHNGT